MHINLYSFRSARRVIPAVAAAAVLAGVLGFSGLMTAGQANAAPAGAAADYFLKLDGVSGESTDAKHKGEIEISSFEWAKGGPGLEQSGNSGSAGGGGGAGKVVVHDISFTAKVSKASPQLLSATASGKHLKEAILTVRRAGKDQLEPMTIKLSDVLVSSYHVGGQDGDMPTDQFSLSFAKVEFSYSPQKADGSLDAPVVGGWDFKTNRDDL